MYWRPVLPKPKPQWIPDRLRQVLTVKFASWGRNELLNGDFYQLSKDDLPYLAGARDAGVEYAQDLMAAINTHGTIEIWCET